MALDSISRRAFIGGAAGVAAVAGLGLAACDSSSSTTTVNDNSVTGEEPLNGSPATTRPDKLPLPKKGQVYNNPLDRDKVKDGGELILPTTEVGPDFNANSVNGGTTYMSSYWGCYMVQANPFRTDATASKFTPNPNYISNVEITDVAKTGKQVVTVDISPKANFNDGTPIDWRAVEALWKTRCGKNPDYTPASTSGYDQIESVKRGKDDKQVVVTFATPYYPPEPLIGFMHPKTADPKTFNSGWNMNPHNEWGSGPFVVDSFDETQITFKRNPKWWGDKAKLDTIQYKQMDSQAIFNAFKNGEIDSTDSGSGSRESLANFSNMKDAMIRRGNSNTITCIEVNTTRPALKDLAVRKAFMQCLDTSTILKIQYQGVNWKEERIGSIMLSTWMDGYENNLPDDVKNLKDAKAMTDAAKKTLEDAGYKMGSDGYYAKDGKTLTFSFTMFGDSNTAKNRAAAIQKMGKSAGMNITIDNKPASEFSKTLTGGGWDTIMFGWSAGTVTYNNGVQIYGKNSNSNFTHAGSDELDKQFKAVCGVADHKKQLEDFNKAEKEALKSYAFIPIMQGADVTVCKKGLANFGPSLFLSVPVENMGWAK